MEPRTYLQQRILDRLGIFAGLVKIEQHPSRETRAAWLAAARIVRTYFDIYAQTYNVGDPLPRDKQGAVLSKAPNSSPPPKKGVDPEHLIV